ncbi:MAG: hypothetical protein QW590_03265, partial [Candidatus Bilamarchaeaceae archaeon]
MSKRMTMKEPVEKKATKTMAALAFAGFMAFNSCVPSAMPSYQIQRYPNLNEKTFVVKNEVSESSFIEMLKERGATNIICS